MQNGAFEFWEIDEYGTKTSVAYDNQYWSNYHYHYYWLIMEASK